MNISNETLLLHGIMNIYNYIYKSIIGYLNFPFNHFDKVNKTKSLTTELLWNVQLFCSAQLTTLHVLLYFILVLAFHKDIRQQI